MLSGIDVSSYQNIQSWPELKSNGVVFMFLKCTEGLRTIDASFSKFSFMATAENILHGAYHFFHPSEDAAAQAAFFLKTVGSNIGTLPPVVDLETTDNVPANQDVEGVLVFLQAVEAGTGKVPIIYGSPSYLNALKLDARFLKYPLWVAEYPENVGPAPTEIPSPWTEWTFWQYSGNGTIEGIVDACDKDYFNGGLAQLTAL